MQYIDQNMLQAANWLLDADSLLITAGAGMGVDSGLPDFRGPQGFWRAYPALRSEQINFQDIANGMAFLENPRRAWGFYGHRLALYRNTVPHAGFEILRQLSSRLQHGGFIYTSNVDGQFQKAGFTEGRVVECHGSIHHLQCSATCTETIWPADALSVHIDEKTCTWQGALPACPHCGGIARPNILMFNDWAWQSRRTDSQNARLDAWRARVQKPLVIELGAGTAVPSVRRKSENFGARLVRINPREPQVRSEDALSFPMGALEALRLLMASVVRLA